MLTSCHDLTTECVYASTTGLGITRLAAHIWSDLCGVQQHGAYAVYRKPLRRTAISRFSSWLRNA